MSGNNLMRHILINWGSITLLVINRNRWNLYLMINVLSFSYTALETPSVCLLCVFINNSFSLLLFRMVRNGNRCKIPYYYIYFIHHPDLTILNILPNLTPEIHTLNYCIYFHYYYVTLNLDVFGLDRSQ